MKKILLVAALILGLGFSANTAIRAGNTGGLVLSGVGFYSLEVKGTIAPTSAAMVWYADNIGGYPSVDLYGFQVSSGSIPTTVSVIPTYSDGNSISLSAQVVTAGTTFTNKYQYLKLSLPAFTVTRNVTFNFLVHD